MAKSYLERSLEWGRRDDARRARQRGAQERRAREQAERAASRTRQFPPDNGRVDGQPAYTTQEGDRTRAWWGADHENEVVANDGLNASYLREGGMDIVDDSQDDPYQPHPHQRRW
jgi:hypothetical protein